MFVNLKCCDVFVLRDVFLRSLVVGMNIQLLNRNVKVFSQVPFGRLPSVPFIQF